LLVILVIINRDSIL